MEKIENNLEGGKIPKQLTDAVAKFKEHVNEIAPEQIDFKPKLSGLSKPLMTLWDEYVQKKMFMQMEWQLMYELGCIKMHPELIDQDLVKEYEEAELDKANIIYCLKFQKKNCSNKKKLFSSFYHK